MQVETAFMDNDLVQGLSPEQISRIADLAERRAYRGGDVIVAQDETSNDLMIVLSGRASINTDQDVTFAQVGPGSVIGEIALLDRLPRSATVESVGETVVAVIPAAKLLSLMDSDPPIALAIYRNICIVMCARLRRSKVQIDHLMSRS